MGPKEQAAFEWRQKNFGGLESPTELVAKLTSVPRETSLGEAARAMGRRGGFARAMVLDSDRRKEIASMGGKAGGRGRPKTKGSE